MFKLCSKALTTQIWASGDVPFQEDDVAQSMYFVTKGEFEYMAGTGQHKLFVRDWITEMVLYTDWQHKGRLVAFRDSEALHVAPKIFMSIVSQQPAVYRF